MASLLSSSDKTHSRTSSSLFNFQFGKCVEEDYDVRRSTANSLNRKPIPFPRDPSKIRTILSMAPNRTSSDVSKSVADFLRSSGVDLRIPIDDVGDVEGTDDVGVEEKDDINKTQLTVKDTNQSEQVEQMSVDVTQTNSVPTAPPDVTLESGEVAS